jgi:hypothetical protein
MKAHKDSRSKTLFFFFGAGWGRWLKPRRGRFIRGKDLVPIEQQAVWTRGPTWNFAENLALAGIHSRIAHLVASCYTDCAIPTQNNSALQ